MRVSTTNTNERRDEDERGVNDMRGDGVEGMSDRRKTIVCHMNVPIPSHFFNKKIKSVLVVNITCDLLLLFSVVGDAVRCVTR